MRSVSKLRTTQCQPLRLQATALPQVHLILLLLRQALEWLPVYIIRQIETFKAERLYNKV